MTAWTDEDLAAIGDAREPLIAAARGDGAFRSDVTVWIVRVGDDLYMRSWRAGEGAGSARRCAQDAPGSAPAAPCAPSPSRKPTRRPGTP